LSVGLPAERRVSELSADEERGDERARGKEQIADPPADRQQAPKRQRVCGDDPLAIVGRECSAF
jgi:hypothetical protein